MKTESFLATIKKVEYFVSTDEKRYVIEYKRKNVPVKDSVVVRGDCFLEEGDNIAITVKDGKIISTNISSTMQKRSLLMLWVFGGILIVIALLIALFLLIDSIIFRVAMMIIIFGVLCLLFFN